MQRSLEVLQVRWSQSYEQLCGSAGMFVQTSEVHVVHCKFLGRENWGPMRLANNPESLWKLGNSWPVYLNGFNATSTDSFRAPFKSSAPGSRNSSVIACAVACLSFPSYLY